MEKLKVKTEKPEKNIIKAAAKAIKSGGLVIFPTETVYGIGANAFDPEAVKKIFKIKNRPQEIPLQVLISDVSQIKQLARDVPKKAGEFMKKHWPGPLTLVLNKSEKVSNAVSGGKDSVGLRMPDHKVILELIKESGVPIAATSANIHGNPSPKTAEEAVKELGSADLVIDGGECKIGVPSTVIDATQDPPKVLRQGSLQIIGE